MIRFITDAQCMMLLEQTQTSTKTTLDLGVANCFEADHADLGEVLLIQSAVGKHAIVFQCPEESFNVWASNDKTA